jgi:microcystin degradation protein MlrC
MRFAVGGFEHETNTFGTIPVTEETLARASVSGQSLLDRYTGVHGPAGGTIDACRDLGIELAPVLLADLGPSGPALRNVYEDFRRRMTEEFLAAHREKPLDAIVLNVHGAGVAEGYPDLEGDLLRAVRACFGDDIPIGIVLDLHANVSPEMIRLGNITVGYKCYPHTDSYESAYKLVCLLHEHLSGEKRLHQALVKLPWHVIPASGETLSGPARDIMLYDQELTETHSDLKDLSFFHGFPYADVPFSGSGVTAVAETPEAALAYARQAAEYAWSRRRDFSAPIYSAAQAMDLAEQVKGVAVINESSDNPGGGAPGDGTHLLREMIKRDRPGSVYGYIYDPAVARQALAAGPGQRIDCFVGGKSDCRHGEPVELKGAYVKTLSDGTYLKKNPMGAGETARIGLTALLQTGNVGVIVSEGRRQVLDDGPFRIVGVDWRDMKIIALKSSQHFKGWWKGRADAIIPCESPGIHSADLSCFDFRYLDKSFYPFADPAGFSPAAEAVH